MTTYPPQPDYRQPQSNGLGIAGFIVSLCGLLSCGLLSIVGLVLSLVALRKEPRGLAIAGAVLGGLGLLLLPLMVGIMMPAMFKARQKAMEIRSELAITNAYYATNQTLPDTQAEADALLRGDGLDFGNDWPRYTKLSERSFELRWAGPDEQFDTADDRVTTWQDPAGSPTGLPPAPNPAGSASPGAPP